jgi:hypothetical protein
MDTRTRAKRPAVLNEQSVGKDTKIPRVDHPVQIFEELFDLASTVHDVNDEAVDHLVDAMPEDAVLEIEDELGDDETGPTTEALLICSYFSTFTSRNIKRSGSPRVH